MKVISLWEPCASLIRCGAKTIETRSWATKYRGPLLICAAKGGLPEKDLKVLMNDHDFQAGLIPLRHQGALTVFTVNLNFGKMVARVNLIDCKKTEEMTIEEIGNNYPFGDFSKGRYAHIYSDIIPVKMARVKGSQGFFNVDDYLIHHEAEL